MPVVCRVFAICLFLAGAGVMGFGQSGRAKPSPTPTPTPNDDTVRIATEEVKLNVVAFDEDGKFVGDVKNDDLVITENNILHQPSSVRRLPANVLIVLDTGGEMREAKSLDLTKRTAKAVVGALRDGDQIAVLEYADKPRLLGEWTADKAQAINDINDANFGRHSAFVDALNMARAIFEKSGVDNKHLVLITDGTDSDRKPSRRYDAFLDLLSTDISVHIISYTKMELIDIEPRAKGTSKTPPPPAMPPEITATLPNGVRNTAQSAKVGVTLNTDRKFLKVIRQRQSDLEDAEDQLGKLAQDSNGEILLPESPEEMVTRSAIVARMIDASYVVTYIPKVPIAEAGGERNITVSSKRDGLIVEARRRLVLLGPGTK